MMQIGQKGKERKEEMSDRTKEFAKQKEKGKWSDILD